MVNGVAISGVTPALSRGRVANNRDLSQRFPFHFELSNDGLIKGVIPLAIEQAHVETVQIVVTVCD